MNYPPYGGYPAGPYSMAQQPPNVIYIPVTTPPGMGMPPPPPPMKGKGKNKMSVNGMIKVSEKLKKIIDEAKKTEKKEEKKDPKLKDKTFTWFEVFLVLTNPFFCLLTGLGVLGCVKAFTILLRSFL